VKKLYKNLPAFLFAGFLAVMMILFLVLPKLKTSSTEKRNLAQAPELTYDKLLSGEFRDSFEKYVSDQLPGRNFWVGLAAYYSVAIGNNGANGIYMGSDGYLINDPQDMRELDFNMGIIDEFAENTDVPCTVLIAPSTGYICSDKLPALHLPYEDDEYFSGFGDILTHADFCDVRDAFKKAYSDGHQIYYKTDHHWTACGAYIAYCQLGEKLGYTPHKESDYEITSYPGFYGTTYSGSGLWLNPSDDIEIWDNHANDKSVKTAITVDGKTTEQDDMFYYAHLDEDDKYPVYLDGNNPITVITNSKADSDKKLLVVKDSFAHSLVPFLADHYAEIVMVDLRYYTEKPVSQLISEEKIDQVLFVYSIDNLGIDDRISFLE